jgi:hypothetical protein
MVKKHHLSLVKPTAAETWFATRPAAVASGKAARFSKAKAA